MSLSIITCPVCGASNLEDDIYCAKCGSDLDSEDDEPH